MEDIKNEDKQFEKLEERMGRDADMDKERGEPQEHKDKIAEQGAKEGILADDFIPEAEVEAILNNLLTQSNQYKANLESKTKEHQDLATKYSELESKFNENNNLLVNKTKEHEELKTKYEQSMKEWDTKTKQWEAKEMKSLLETHKPNSNDIPLLTRFLEGKENKEALILDLKNKSPYLFKK